jgi:ketosteroid isomerase-like protein
MTFSGPEADRMAIRELMECYADAASRIDKAQWLGCWAPDAVWVMRQGDIVGLEALSQTWDTIFGAVDALAFFAMPGAIAVTGDTASARCHVREIVRRGSDVSKLSARYDDELVRHEGRWKFARRTYVMNIEE